MEYDGTEYNAEHIAYNGNIPRELTEEDIKKFIKHYGVDRTRPRRIKGSWDLKSIEDLKKEHGIKDDLDELFKEEL